MALIDTDPFKILQGLFFYDIAQTLSWAMMSWSHKHPLAVSHTATQCETAGLPPTILVQCLMKTEAKLKANERYKFQNNPLLINTATGIPSLLYSILQQVCG